MTVGERIRQKRIELNMSQDELAKKTGYKSRSSIQKIECARNLPLSKVEIMARALDCSPSVLMGWDEVETFDTPEAFEAHWNRIGGGRHPIELTDEEYTMVLEYRNADTTTKETINRALAYYRLMKGGDQNDN